MSLSSNVVTLESQRKSKAKEERKPVALTDSAARKADLPAPHEANYILYRDIKQSAFCLRVTKGGSRAWCVDKWANGKMNRVAIAPIADLSAEEARKRAQVIIGDLHKGIDPHAERARERGEATTLSQGITAYIAMKPTLAARTKSDYEGLRDRELSPWAKLKLNNITPEKAREMHGKIEGDTRADYAIRLLRATMNAHGLPNPVARVKGIKFPTRQKQAARKARLEPSSANEAWEVFGALENVSAGAMFRTTMLTGMRPEEATSLTVGMVNLRARRIDLPITKNQQDHRLYIAPELAEELKPHLKGKQDDDLVFPDCADPRKSLKSAVKALGIRFSRYDLRKLAARIAQECHVPHPCVRQLLNHSEKTGDITARHYAQPTESQMRDAFERIAKFATGRAA